MQKKAVALVSGGKDSVYAIHCARQAGFSIIAVATLLPRDNAAETDSYMYQSVATNLGVAIAECLGVPHYSAHVKGRPVNTETLQYTFDSDDEVHDLLLLLKRVTHEHPEIEAVTCGAILSEYQRRRLEYICGCARLLPVCLLWNREQKSLLKNMIDWGLHAVVVKTASMGLSKQHLGRSVSDLLPHFLELNRQFDFHVCGEGTTRFPFHCNLETLNAHRPFQEKEIREKEKKCYASSGRRSPTAESGGEYETVTLDCPLFTTGSIAVSDWEQICHSDDAVAPVWLQCPVHWKVVPKKPTTFRPPGELSSTLNVLEWLRTKPYQDLIDAAVKDWGVDTNDRDSAPATPLCGEGTHCRIGPHSICPSNKNCRWTLRSPASCSGGILTGDVCVSCSKESGEVEGDTSSPPEGSSAPPDPDLMSSWLGEQLSKTLHSGVRTSIVEAVCQVCCPDYMRVPEKVFERLGIRPVVQTVVVAPLPLGVKLRLRIVVSHSEGSTVSSALYLKPFTDDSVLHVHSVNLWVPPCSERDWRAADRIHLCNACQGVRCELASESSLRVSQLFLRGCDGRLPFTCDFPDEVNGPVLIPSRWRGEEYRRRKPAFYTALQTVNAFVSLQYTRHLCYAGGANRGFPHDDCQPFIDEVELGEACSAKPQDIDSASLHVPQMKTPHFMPLCIVVFVNPKEGKEATRTNFDKKLGVVKQLLHSLIGRSSPRSDNSFSGDDGASQSIVVVAEAPSLPKDARVLMLPMWDISPRVGDRECSQTCSAKQMRQQGEKYTVTIAVVERCLTGTKDTETPVAGGCDNTICSVVVCLSFQRRHDYTGHYTLEDFVEQLSITLTQWLSVHPVGGDFASSSSADTEGSVTVQGRGRMREVCVFYCPSYLRLLQTDSESFEAICQQRIEAGCCKNAAASSDILPIITFFPVLNLAGGLLEIVAHTLCA
ncbi:hypothetical protein, conserved [Eimeria brunetti]|uniref:Diphthine--ammonia ligase n=1 Tax=Eimeria brunetti TaxID=51314 RepID=U6L872_9EIME|nr:hypothetical protein, conserved [Eimeria brunetti]